MKKTFFIFFLLPFICKAQGWNANSPTNSLFTINSGGTGNNVNVGIGTNAPSTQLHTTGGVRFAGLTNNNALTRIVVCDNTGNLSFRNASTLDGTTTAW